MTDFIRELVIGKRKEFGLRLIGLRERYHVSEFKV